MISSLYTKDATLIHRLDPRTKIMILLASFILPFLSSHPLFILSTAIPVLIHLAISRSWSNIRRFRGLLAGLFVFTFIIWFSSSRSLLHGISMAVRIDTFVIAGIIFFSTTRTEELSLGLIKLGLPYPVSFALTTSFRLIPTLIQTGTITMQAQSLRGLDLSEGGIKQRIKNYIPLLVPIFINSLRGSHQLSMALESRGFSTGKKRSSYLKIGYKAVDIIVIASLLCLLISSIIIKYYWP